MSGMADWQAKISIDIDDLKKRIKVAEGELDKVTKEDRKIKLDIDTKTLESAIQKLDKMLDSLGKGTGDFKQLENLSKELSAITSEVKDFSKAFGKLDDSGAKTLLSSIQNIDRSLSELSQNILNVNKNMNNMGGNTGGAVKQVENITNESKKAASALEDVAKAQAKVNGQKTNISSERKDAFPDKDVSASTESVTNSIKEENNVLEQNTQKIKENTQAKAQNANVNLNKYDKRLDSYNGKIDKYQATIDRFNDGGWTSDTYLKNVQAVRDAVKQYATLLDNIKTNQNGIATDEDIQNLDEYEKKIKDTIATVTNMSASEKGYSRLAGQKEIDKINKILRENSAMSSEAKAKIKAYKQELISGNPSVSLEKIHGEIMKLVNAEELAGRAGRSMFDVIKEKAFYGFAAQIGMYFGFNDIINGFKQVASTIRELDTAYTEMRKVSDESAQSLKNFQKESFSTADSVGTTALAMQDATATWMRLGESLDDAKESAKDATVLLNVSEFDNIDEATDSLVAMSQAYKDLDKMEIIDVLDKIGNEYSISTDQLSTALKDSAAVLKTQGNDLAESVALITAGKVITCIYRNIYNRMNLIAGNA